MIVFFSVQVHLLNKKIILVGKYFFGFKHLQLLAQFFLPQVTPWLAVKITFFVYYVNLHFIHLPVS